jgi:hypothetical protein
MKPGSINEKQNPRKRGFFMRLFSLRKSKKFMYEEAFLFYTCPYMNLSWLLAQRRIRSMRVSRISPVFTSLGFLFRLPQKNEAKRQLVFLERFDGSLFLFGAMGDSAHLLYSS